MIDTFSKRLKIIRHFLEKTREEFAKLIEVPEITIRSWELKNVIPNDKSLYKIVENLKKNNIVISSDWLLTGHGQNPFQNNEVKTHNSLSLLCDTFLTVYPHGLTLKIVGNIFLPFFKSGDIIGAIPFSDLKAHDLVIKINHTCKEDIKIYQTCITEEKKIILAPIHQGESFSKVYSKNDQNLYKIIFTQCDDLT